MNDSGRPPAHLTQPAKPVRVGRFDWERLMLMSPLPRATKGILLALGVFMSEDGGDARPGLDNLAMATGRGRSVLIEHLAVAVAAGYLHVVERGGFRRKTARATEYAAVVPKHVWVDRDQILRAPPWRRAYVRTSGEPDIGRRDEGPENRTLTVDEGPVFEDEGPVFASRTSGKPDPTTQFHHAPNTTSPLPPVAPPEPSGASAEEEGEDRSGQETQIAALVDAIREIRPRWSKKKITDAITASIDDGRPWEAIALAFPRLAADPETEYPGRLPQDGPWWEIDQQPRTSERAAGLDVAALIRAAERDGPHCEDHDIPGGKFPHPIHGTPLCAYCRRGLPPRKPRQETMTS